MMDSVEKKQYEHEIECAERYGQIQASITTLVTNQAWLTKLIWFIIAAILSFELNAVFKLIGH